MRLNATYFSRNPFGQLEDATGAGGTLNPGTGYTGASTPNSTGGFTYLRNRWYDPQTGRFLTQDPIGLAGGMNLYAYAGNNPVAFSDPFGLMVDTVKFEGERKDELEAAWRRSKNILRASSGEGDLEADVALRAMEEAETSEAVIVFRTDLTMNTSGLTSDGIARINPDFIKRHSERYYLPLTVTHEFGHAYAQVTGRLGYSGLMSLGFENSVRRALRMNGRRSHSHRPLLRGE